MGPADNGTVQEPSEQTWTAGMAIGGEFHIASCVMGLARPVRCGVSSPVGPTLKAHRPLSAGWVGGGVGRGIGGDWPG